jgi:hypothetical protein
MARFTPRPLYPQGYSAAQSWRSGSAGAKTLLRLRGEAPLPGNGLHIATERPAPPCHTHTVLAGECRHVTETADGVIRSPGRWLVRAQAGALGSGARRPEVKCKQFRPLPKALVSPCLS